MHIHADVAAQLLGHLLVDGQAITVGDEIVGGRYRGAVNIHRRESAAEHADTDLLPGVAGLDGNLLRQVLGCLDK